MKKLNKEKHFKELDYSNHKNNSDSKSIVDRTNCSKQLKQALYNADKLFQQFNNS